MWGRITAAGLAGLLLLAAGSVRAGSCGPGTALFRSGFEGGCAERARSAFLQLSEDRVVAGPSAVVLLEHELALARPATLFAFADGRHFPLAEEAAALWISVDGSSRDGSRSLTSWRDSRRPVQHAFRVLAVRELEAGSHRVALMAQALPGDREGFVVGSASGLGLLVAPDSLLQPRFLTEESDLVRLRTYDPEAGIDVVEGAPDRPFLPLLRNDRFNPGSEPLPVVTLLAGHARHACRLGGEDGYGDALWGLWHDRRCPNTAEAAWSVNDLDPLAELWGTMFTHAATTLAPGTGVEILWGASELAFGSDQADAPAGAHENEVCYRVDDAALITASGTGIVGGAEPVLPVASCSTYTWRCVASTEGVVGCPEAGSWVVLGAADIEVPAGHDGLVYFSAVTRVQGDNADSFSTASLQLRVDGEWVGTVGVQQLALGAGQASRTLSASWLSAVDSEHGPLAPGSHRVEALMRVEGERVNFVSAPRDIALTFFD